jgi:two-component system CheB/CheR fusion protein
MNPVKPGGRLRVLAVDDDEDTCESIALLVRLSGHDARTARDGATALAVAAGYEPDVVLLDVAMPGMDGWTLAKRLRANPGTRHAYIVGVSGFARDEDQRRSLDAGCDDHWAKPFDGAQLGRLLESLQAGQSR